MSGDEALKRMMLLAGVEFSHKKGYKKHCKRKLLLEKNDNSNLDTYDLIMEMMKRRL